MARQAWANCHSERPGGKPGHSAIAILVAGTVLAPRRLFPFPDTGLSGPTLPSAQSLRLCRLISSLAAGTGHTTQVWPTRPLCASGIVVGLHRDMSLNPARWSQSEPTPDG